MGATSGTPHQTCIHVTSPRDRSLPWTSAICPRHNAVVRCHLAHRPMSSHWPVSRHKAIKHNLSISAIFTIFAIVSIDASHTHAVSGSSASCEIRLAASLSFQLGHVSISRSHRRIITQSRHFSIDCIPTAACLLVLFATLTLNCRLSLHTFITPARSFVKRVQQKIKQRKKQCQASTQPQAAATDQLYR